MSSMIALQRQPATRGTAHVRHRSLARTERTGALADRIAMHIESLVPQGRAECLAVGSGDLELVDNLEERLVRPRWHCIDVERKPPASGDRSFNCFDGEQLPFAEGALDVALLCDIFHGAPKAAPRLLLEAGRVATHVLVKDRFRDRRGAACFTQEAFARLLVEQSFTITALDCALDRCEAARAPARDSHFIAVLRRR